MINAQQRKAVRPLLLAPSLKVTIKTSFRHNPPGWNILLWFAYYCRKQGALVFCRSQFIDNAGADNDIKPTLVLIAKLKQGGMVSKSHDRPFLAQSSELWSKPDVRFWMKYFT